MSLQTTVTKGIVKGKTYTFRYRAINAVGAGGWSPITEIPAASIPLAPPRPIYSSSTSTTITISLSTSTDNGGSKILYYELYRDGGDLSTPINILESTYDGASLSFVVSSLTAGENYRF